MQGELEKEFVTTVYEQKIRNCKDGSKILRIILESNSEVQGDFCELVKFLAKVNVNEEVKIKLTRRTYGDSEQKVG